MVQARSLMLSYPLRLLRFFLIETVDGWYCSKPKTLQVVKLLRLKFKYRICIEEQFKNNDPWNIWRGLRTMADCRYVLTSWLSLMKNCPDFFQVAFSCHILVIFCLRKQQFSKENHSKLSANHERKRLLSQKLFLGVSDQVTSVLISVDDLNDLNEEKEIRK